MKVKDQDRVGDRAEVLKALGHPSRLLIVQALAAGPLCVRDLTELVGSEMSTISRHLAQLKQVGLLSDSREGTKIFYGLRTPCVLRFIDCIDNVIQHEKKTKGRR